MRGQAYCWGANESGQLGLGDTEPRGGTPEGLEDAFNPVIFPPAAENEIIQLATGERHTCVLQAGGSVRWGANESGQLGQGDRMSRGGEAPNTPALIPAINLPPTISIVAGARHTCALSDEYEVRCWGLGTDGQLGQGARASLGDDPQEMEALVADPVSFPPNARVVQLTAGSRHTCALTESGTVFCWGANQRGQLGIDSANAIGDEILEMGRDLQPVRLNSAADAVAAGSAHTCALLENGNLHCWGDNSDGQLGLGLDTLAVGDAAGEMENQARRITLPDASTVIGLSLGHAHTCVVQLSGYIGCWGRNDAGQLGVPDVENLGLADGDIGGLETIHLGDGCTACDVGQMCTNRLNVWSADCNADGLCSFAGCAERDCPLLGWPEKRC